MAKPLILKKSAKAAKVFYRKISGLLPKGKYKPSKYWRKRHNKYGFDLRGVGNCTLSHEENAKVYESGKRVFYQLCEKQGIDFSTAHTLEIGCGTGFFTKAFLENGGKDYLGIDITSVPLEQLRKEYSNFSFRKQDITKEQLKDKYDLIIMIDVTQHIVENGAFAFAMENVSSHLKPGGAFIVTSWLTDDLVQRTYYEVSRPLSYYESYFPDFEFSDPIPFRDKYIFTIRNQKDQ